MVTKSIQTSPKESSPTKNKIAPFGAVFLMQFLMQRHKCSCIFIGGYGAAALLKTALNGCLISRVARRDIIWRPSAPYNKIAIPFIHQGCSDFLF